MTDERYPSRRKSRKHAIEVVYAALIRDDDPMMLLATTSREAGWSRHPWFAYAQELVAGVERRTEELDEIISGASERWSVDRMSRTDLAILRVASFELLEQQEVPAAVITSEAAHLAEELSADDSPRFIQGVLSRIAAQR